MALVLLEEDDEDVGVAEGGVVLPEVAAPDVGGEVVDDVADVAGLVDTIFPFSRKMPPFLLQHS